MPLKAPKPQLGEGGAEVARLAELLVDPGVAERLGVALEHAVAFVARGEGLEQLFGLTSHWKPYNVGGRLSLTS